MHCTIRDYYQVIKIISIF